MPDFVEKFQVKLRQGQMGPPGIPEQNRQRKDTSTARYRRKKGNGAISSIALVIFA